ncbi:MAG: hypothetical protein P9F19_14245 [Candidatus Contendobacter sp.]|nr:hypothetical protein [Candidatus Contendobacter sp.]MDG4558533.1 hypothetical protein [Candidatus Contendobacter sp.]
MLTALVEWLTEPEQTELRRSLLLWLREGFLQTRLPRVSFSQLDDLEEVRIMLAERVLDWTRQWKEEGRQEGREEGLHSEWRLLLRLVRRRFGEAIADRSAPVLERIKQPAALEDLGEELLDCADATAWLARLNAAAGEGRRSDAADAV